MVEEDKQPDDDEENDDIADFIEDMSNNNSQFNRSKTFLPNSSGKLIGTRANHKKRNHGQFQHEHANLRRDNAS